MHGEAPSRAAASSPEQLASTCGFRAWGFGVSGLGLRGLGFLMYLRLRV